MRQNRRDAEPPAALRPTDPQPAFVLHARPYRETSLLLELLTVHDGRIGAIARGVRAARGQPLRAALQPLQPLLVSLRGRGELPLLVAAEVQGGAAAVAGDPLLAAFYVNELLVRLLPRHDPNPTLFARYAALLDELAGSAALGWTLRRFERDLLEAIGYGLQLATDAAGQPVAAAGHYRYDAERGPVPVAPAPHALPGAALLALANDTEPPRELLLPLRRLLRARLVEQLGTQPLHSWALLGDLSALR
jgi:DNA repair protein RecO (recombination protein O)